jgi:hypothetical protein
MNQEQKEEEVEPEFGADASTTAIIVAEEGGGRYGDGEGHGEDDVPMAELVDRMEDPPLAQDAEDVMPKFPVLKITLPKPHHEAKSLIIAHVRTQRRHSDIFQFVMFKEDGVTALQFADWDSTFSVVHHRGPGKPLKVTYWIQGDAAPYEDLVAHFIGRYVQGVCFDCRGRVVAGTSEGGSGSGSSGSGGCEGHVLVEGQ